MIHKLLWKWYQSRVYFAWSNRCWRCLVKNPYHGEMILDSVDLDACYDGEDPTPYRVFEEPFMTRLEEDASWNPELDS